MGQDQFLDIMLHMSENEKNMHMRIALIYWLGNNFNKEYFNLKKE